MSACLIYDVPEKNADLYYATGFRCPDAFVFFGNEGKKYVLLNDYEIDRAKKEARVDEVLSLSQYSERALKKGKGSGLVEIVSEVLSEYGIKSLSVPQSTSFALVDGLRKSGFEISAGLQPFFPERCRKSAAEKKYILESQRAVFAAMSFARDLLKASKIKGRRLIYKGKALTSERLRTMINIFLMERGLIASDTIVSCGSHSIDPHDIGAGPLYANESIIVDIYPRSMKTWFYGDATRTFCRGRAPEPLKKIYATVKEGQALGLKMVKASVPGREIHGAIHAYFESQGFETGIKEGRQQGFFHGTGHSIGLEVHEEPLRIKDNDYVLEEGNVMSVEPGLYYKDIGGVRIEDLVFVTATSCEILGAFPKQLEVL